MAPTSDPAKGDAHAPGNTSSETTATNAVSNLSIAEKETSKPDTPATSNTSQPPILVIDPVTGESVSKNELKKREKKREKSAKAAQHKLNKPTQPVSEPKGAAPEVFAQGFLKDIFDPAKNGRNTKPVITRFPPEPNGYLHIGHAKAIFVNFGFAKYHGGKCILRFDDTNPEAELSIYFTAIEDMVRWLGFTPAAITYSSDNFDQLYELAEKLITLERAYMCYCNDAEIKKQRGGIDITEADGTNDKAFGGERFRCKHAEQSVEYNLTDFRAMRDGKYKPREAFLRMKQDITDGNPQMWDLAAYRVKEEPHHRTGSKWKIYPTYDFTHCICDSIEKITHSLCTTEFILSRVSYEWLNSTLGIYEPMQREYGRLEITGTVLSKRKIKKLVEDKYVNGWDDPRLFTLIGIKRRGVPPGALLEFVSDLGVSPQKSVIELVRFEGAVRKYLERTVPRLMVVIDPIAVIIEDGEELDLEIPFSKAKDMGSHTLKLTKKIYIDRSDFKEVDSPDFFRLAPGKSVGLLQVPHPIKAVSFTKDGDKITEIKAVYDKSEAKPAAYIHWVPEGSRKAEVRMYQSLFTSDEPGKGRTGKDGWLQDVNSNSLEIFPNALVESGFDEIKARAPWPEAAGESERGVGGPESVRFQAMRTAYMAMDPDSTEDHLVLNRIVGLKEDSGKKA